jgi:hypothetical protein
LLSFQVGLLTPAPTPVESLKSGQVLFNFLLHILICALASGFAAYSVYFQVGYVMAKVKASADILVGDTLASALVKVEPLTK